MYLRTKKERRKGSKEVSYKVMRVYALYKLALNACLRTGSVAADVVSDLLNVYTKVDIFRDTSPDLQAGHVLQDQLEIHSNCMIYILYSCGLVLSDALLFLSY